MSTHILTARTAALAAAFALCAHAVTAQGITQPKQGKGGSDVQGAAGTGGSSGGKGLEHCDKPMGAIAVVKPQDHIIQALARYSCNRRLGESRPGRAAIAPDAGASILGQSVCVWDTCVSSSQAYSLSGTKVIPRGVPRTKVVVITSHPPSTRARQTS